ncbi:MULTISPECIES: PAS domain-containing protein [Pseudomonas]|uniref:PAS domain S-box-containing protein n=1 Tax=Pseudomonas poae TaxID=200451 RepID=A0AAP2WGH1_9PSED|nr:MULTISPECIES: PAS domain-containing protein [Pseudomonas]ELQ19000.1 putative regulatory protein [Pseudomonas fluorescens BRIP34879]KTC40537.1 histidine kinase [Pseudomonas sp. ABAC21]AGE27352.1 putative regulatory protein [Pseudomonas poae RE*1-1-14]KRP43393.1 histidine kinase [Pseudomonas poae]MBC3198830.1 PAS domain-containing protein [Pseudomonas poae]
MINPNLMQMVINASNDGIVVAEREGRETPVIYVNPAFERLTGYTLDEILYQDCRFLQTGDRDQPGLTVVRKAMQEGTSCREVLRNYRKDGTPFWNELSLSTLYNEADKLTYFIGVQKDVTLQVKAEQRVVQLEAELARVKSELAALKAAAGSNKV